MHVPEIVSMVLVLALSMFLRLPDPYDYCICNYRLGQGVSLTIPTRKGAISPFVSPPARRLRSPGRPPPPQLPARLAAILPSPQDFIWSQHCSHLLRRENGRPQAAQIFAGRFCFRGPP